MYLDYQQGFIAHFNLQEKKQNKAELEINRISTLA